MIFSNNGIGTNEGVPPPKIDTADQMLIRFDLFEIPIANF